MDCSEETKIEKVEEFLASRNEPGYRFKQITQAIFQQRIDDFEKMTTLSKQLRIELKEKFGNLLAVKPIEIKKARRAVKILFELGDAERVESVRMDYQSGRKTWKSLCVSSQVGCNLGCAFCATGKIGLKRNLTADEIVGQVLHFHLQGDDIHSVSFMGMGEPLLNDNIFEAIKILVDPRFFNFSERRINISTVGVVPGLKDLTAKFPQTNIAFSLHNAIEKEREKLMPISRVYPIEKVMAVLDEGIIKNRRKVFLVYMMLKDINDKERHLDALKGLIKKRKRFGYLYHVNLIVYNKIVVAKNQFEPSDAKVIDWFKEGLEKENINVTVRQSLGGDIDAACGQLYAKYHPSLDVPGTS